MAPMRRCRPALRLDYKTKKGFIVALNLGVMIRTADQGGAQRPGVAPGSLRPRNTHTCCCRWASAPWPSSMAPPASLTARASTARSKRISAGAGVHRTGITVNLGGGRVAHAGRDDCAGRCSPALAMPFVQKRRSRSSRHRRWWTSIPIAMV